MASDDAKTEINEVGSVTTQEQLMANCVQSEETTLEVNIETKQEPERNKETKAKMSGSWQNLISAKRVFDIRLQKCFCSDRIDDQKTRLYHVWPGNNVFFFGGRLVCGPDPKGLLLTIMAISLSSWIFNIYVANDMQGRNSIVVTICSIVLVFIVLGSLGMVGMTDPGIIPRSDRWLTDRSMRKTMEINGVEVRLKYCRTCNIYHMPRCRHCVVCDNCVEKFDHHCPWIGQCIGQRNYRVYVIFLFTGFVFFAYIFGFSFQKVHHSRMFQDDAGLMELLRNCPEALALTTFSFAAAWFLGGLTCYHLYLIILNQTAYENFHQLYARSRNPYDRGVLSNIMEFVCVSPPPSRVNFRAEVIEQDNPLLISAK